DGVDDLDDHRLERVELDGGVAGDDRHVVAVAVVVGEEVGQHHRRGGAEEQHDRRGPQALAAGRLPELPGSDEPGGLPPAGHGALPASTSAPSSEAFGSSTGWPAASRNSSERLGASTPKSSTRPWARTRSSTAPGSVPGARRSRLPAALRLRTVASAGSTQSSSTWTLTRR